MEKWNCVGTWVIHSGAWDCVITVRGCLGGERLWGRTLRKSVRERHVALQGIG